MNNIDYSQIGISKTEYIVYTELLTNPPQTVTELSRRLGLNRTTLYQVLDSLVEKKLISINDQTVSGFKYVAARPEMLVKYAEEQKQRAEEQVKKIAAAVPLLKMQMDVSNLDDQPQVIVAHGGDEFTKLYKLFDLATEPITGFVYEDYYPGMEATVLMTDEHGQLIKGQTYVEAVLRVGDKFTFPSSEPRRQAYKRLFGKNPQLKGKWQPRWLEKDTLDISINMFTFNDVVLMSEGVGENLVGYYFRSQALARTLRSLSLFLWSAGHEI